MALFQMVTLEWDLWKAVADASPLGSFAPLLVAYLLSPPPLGRSQGTQKVWGILDLFQIPGGGLFSPPVLPLSKVKDSLCECLLSAFFIQKEEEGKQAHILKHALTLRERKLLGRHGCGRESRYRHHFPQVLLNMTGENTIEKRTNEHVQPEVLIYIHSMPIYLNDIN